MPRLLIVIMGDELCDDAGTLTMLATDNEAASGRIYEDVESSDRRIEARSERQAGLRPVGGSEFALVDLAHGVASDGLNDVDRSGALVGS